MPPKKSNQNNSPKGKGKAQATTNPKPKGKAKANVAAPKVPKVEATEPRDSNITLRQTRARSRLNNAPPLMEGLDNLDRPVAPLPAEPDFISFNEVVRRLGGTENMANREKARTKIILRRRAAASAAGPSNPNQSSGPSSSSRPAAGPANLTPSSSPSAHSEPSVESSPAAAGPSDQNQDQRSSSEISSLPSTEPSTPEPFSPDQPPSSSSSSEPSSLPSTEPSTPEPLSSSQPSSSSSSSELSTPTSSELSTPYRSSPDRTRSSAPSPEPAFPASRSIPSPPLAGHSSMIPSSSSSSSSDSGVSMPDSPNRTSPPPNQQSPDTLKVDMLVAVGQEQPSSDGHESDGDGCSGDPPHDDSDEDGGSSGYDPSSEDTSDNTEFTGSESSSSDEDSDDENDDTAGGPCSGPSGSGGPRDPPSSSGLPLDAGFPGNQGDISGYEADNEIASGRDGPAADPLSPPFAEGSDSTNTLEDEESDIGISPTLTTSERSPGNRSACAPGFSSPRPDGQPRRPNRPADVMLPPTYVAGYSQNDSEANDRVKQLRIGLEEHREVLMQTAQQAIRQLESFPTSSDGVIGKRKRSSDDEDASVVGTKRRQSSSPRLTVGTSTTTITTTHSSVVSSQIAESRHDAPDAAGDSPMVDVAYAKMATPRDGLSSGELSPLVMPSFDHEIPDMYGSGLRARRHYDWYEQWHYVGYECYHVHPCSHNPGRECHDCHTEWHKAWARFFKAEDLLEEAAADPEKYLRETGLDLRKDFMGALLQGATWEINAPHLQPPAGGKVRIHPTRTAKHRLALAQIAAQE
ncbi:hypothetical protein IL306_001791 [Fusarium sp. DS 682]|nr:hypothetical protein IL306_001791 [Fusarium sp. DS 682]